MSLGRVSEVRLVLPKNIYVLGAKFSICQECNPNSLTLGDTDERNRVITIQTDQTSMTQAYTLLHEYLHALLSVTGYGQIFAQVQRGPVTAGSEQTGETGDTATSGTGYELEELFVVIATEGITQFMHQFGKQFIDAMEGNGDDSEYDK